MPLIISVINLDKDVSKVLTGGGEQEGSGEPLALWSKLSSFSETVSHFIQPEEENGANAGVREQESSSIAENFSLG